MVTLHSLTPRSSNTGEAVRQSVSASLDRPLIPAAITFALGIASASFGWLPSAALIALFTAVAVLNRAQVRQLAAIACIFLTLGTSRQFLTAEHRGSGLDVFGGPGYATLTGRICSDVFMKRDLDTFFFSASTIQRGDIQSRPINGLIAVRVHQTQPRAHLDYGDSIVARGRLESPSEATNDGGFDYRAYLANREVQAVFNVRRASDWSIAQSGAAPDEWIGRSASHLRSSIVHSFTSSLSPTEASLLSGVVIGARTDLPSTLNDDFVATGTVHILATAGLHVGIFLGVIVAMCRVLRLARMPSTLLQLVALVLYAVMAGSRPSVVRAALVAGIFVAGKLLEREFDFASALSAAALTLLVISPGYLFDMGFQLSFATVITIVILMPVVEPFLAALKEPPSFNTGVAGKALYKGLYFAAGIICMSFAAQLGSAPITAQYFNQISIVGIAANAIVVPLLFPLMSVGLVVWLCSLMSSTLAALLSSIVVSPLLAITIGATRFFASLPAAEVNVRSPGWYLIFGYYAVLFAGATLLRRRLAAGRQSVSV